MADRTEKDFLGERQIREEVYWGIHTQRALENFPISGYLVHPALIRALAIVKKACCQTNLELGYIHATKAHAILRACEEVIEGRWMNQFPLDALQGGAGTSIHMNINEVLANRATELLGGHRGDGRVVHPLEDVNRHQSTNDVVPTSLKIASIYLLRELSEEIAQVQGAFQRKEKEFARILKIGRTELQPAVPITLGAEFSAFGEAMARDRWRAFKSEERLRVVNLGGTAVGTGLTAPRSFIFLVIERLREITGLGLARGENLLDATANLDAFVEVSGILKAHAANLIKIADDLRRLNLLGQIRLPVLQVGSSIMPGKINPVVLEAVIQAGIKVMANDFIIAEVCSRASLQICEFIPLLAHAFLESVSLLIRVNKIFSCHIEGIEADEEICREEFNRSLMIITAFLPRIGYNQAVVWVREFISSGAKDMRRFLVEKLGAETVDQFLTPERLLSLGYFEDENDA